MLEKFNNDIIVAMKEKNKTKLAVLRMLKGAMQLEVINKKVVLNDDLFIDNINKQIRTRQEAIIEFEKGNRQDLVSQNKLEIEILKEYLPEQLNDLEAQDIITSIFNELKPTSIKDMKIIMQEAYKKLNGKYDAKKTSQIIKDKLNSL